MLSRKLAIFLVSLVVLGLLGWGISRALHPLVTATLGGQVLSLEIADTGPLRQKGLSGHAPLGSREGMLFVFPEDGFHSFWMKDMLFPIDIIWLDKEYRIVDVWEYAKPESYPQSVAPKLPARFVVELPAGFFQEYKLKVGNVLEIAR